VAGSISTLADRLKRYLPRSSGRMETQQQSCVSSAAFQLRFVTLLQASEHNRQRACFRVSKKLFFPVRSFKLGSGMQQSWSKPGRAGWLEGNMTSISSDEGMCNSNQQDAAELLIAQRIASWLSSLRSVYI